MHEDGESFVSGFISGTTVAALIWALFVTFWPGSISAEEFEDTSALICWEDTVLLRDAETQVWHSAVGIEINFCR